MEDKMILIQQLCQQLNVAIEDLKSESKKFYNISNDEEMMASRYYSEKMDHVSHYLVYLSKQMENRKDYLRNGIAFYMWNNNRKEN